MKQQTTNKQRTGKLGIIAGAGALPHLLIEYCQKINRPFFVLALKNQAQPDSFSADVPVQWVRLGGVGAIMRAIKTQHITEAVMVGSVRRPSLREIFPDWAGLQVAFRIGLNQKGDDGLLRGIIQEFEKLGVCVRGVHEFLPELLAPVGALTKKQPDVFDIEDISRGCYVAKLLGLADAGQSVIIQRGLVLTLEGIEGTQKMVERSKALRRKGKGGVLVKTVKPQQEHRVDMPTIGVSTVEAVAAAGLKGIAVEAGKVIILDANAVAQKADQLNIFVVGVSVDDILPIDLKERLNILTGHVSSRRNLKVK